MYQYYIDEQKQIYKVYEKANHVYRLLNFNDDELKSSELKKMLTCFKATDLDFSYLIKTKNLIKLQEKEYLELIGS